MIPSDDTTFYKKLELFCISCGSGKVRNNGQPFYADADALLIIVPLKCRDCGYDFSLNIDINPEPVCFA